MQLKQQYFGYVSSIMSFGVFVSFLDTLQALIPLRLLSSRFVKDAKDVVRLGQAVCVTCTDLKDNKMEASLANVKDPEMETLYMLSLEEEQLRLMDLGKAMELNVSDEEEEEEEEEKESEEMGLHRAGEELARLNGQLDAGRHQVRIDMEPVILSWDRLMQYVEIGLRRTALDQAMASMNESCNGSVPALVQ